MSGRKRLTSFVHVAGRVYGPDDDVPADVAKLITNPKAWGEAAADTIEAEPEPDGRSDGEETTGQVVGYSESTVKELRAEIDARNTDRDEDDQIVPDGKNKPDLVAALQADDEAASE